LASVNSNIGGEALENVVETVSNRLDGLLLLLLCFGCYDVIITYNNIITQSNCGLWSHQGKWCCRVLLRSFASDTHLDVHVRSLSHQGYRVNDTDRIS